MPQNCSICSHPDCQAINAALIKGDSLREIAGQFPGLSKSSIARHKEHLPTTAIVAAGRDKALQLVGTVDKVLADFEDLRQQFKHIAKKAAAMNDLDAEISAMREVRATMTDCLKAKGMWAPAVLQINNPPPSLLASPEWPILMRVLERHPSVRQELMAALQEAGL